MFYRRMAERALIGGVGEDIASRFLKRLNYRIIARNWRCPLGEIDIIARLADTVVFIEVKTTHKQAGYLPEDHVTSAKRRRLARLAFYYLTHELHDPGLSYQIDILSITLEANDTEATIRHYPNAISDSY